ncbi:transforming growth factor beta-1-induced transcript 1 protein-like isoform X3 [Xenia sp. Carnegie-2017]|uniref:transforming growth factor beta-1-induced transcript 1 protein-like isoform X3 n=1 Tax=Xenia sp. Carnegie-2017 TaxID=2897299 RepID=UPI001F041E9E|nr:transforming growth factor beta-1-induced transcript 1 protein-like isoform X3 [Xenia sp. Carnegie-2017]
MGLQPSKSNNNNNGPSEKAQIGRLRLGHDKKPKIYENYQELFAGRTYDVIEPPQIEERPKGDRELPELPVDMIESDFSLYTGKEHIYETIDDVNTRDNSSQTESFCMGNETFMGSNERLTTSKEISCQTEPETRRNYKRSSGTQEKISNGIMKNKECRLSSDSSTSTQDSQESVDSGHYSGRNFDKSPRTPTDESSYLWQPEGLSNDEVKSFMDSLPLDSVPSMLTPEGIAHFNAQLAHQNPKQDADPRHCKNLTKAQETTLKALYMTLLKARGTGYIRISDNNTDSCDGCGNSFTKNDMVVSTGHGLRHPSCFSCIVCHQFLTKLIYYSDDKHQLYCGRHYAELFKPRCYECDELIVSGEIVRAMGKTYHAEHFRCRICKKVIGEGKYTTENDEVVCVECHKLHYAEECVSCGKKITLGQKSLSIGQKHWHEKCFTCDECDVQMVRGTFKLGNGKVLCSKCYQQKNNRICCTCGEPIKSGQQWLEHDELFYHAECFRCKNCQREITSKFKEKSGFFYCTDCHRDLFAKKCKQCGQAVLEDGITYDNEIWHNACFVCHNCKQPLSTRKFLLRDGLRYCNICYEDMFAKQCHSCGKKIKGGAYLTTNNLFWHSDCFKCADCHIDLSNIGFHMFGDNTYCSNCPSL